MNESNVLVAHTDHLCVPPTHWTPLCEKLAFLSRSREWPLTPTSDEARALVCDHQMKPDGRVFERDVWLDGRTHVVRPAAASGRTTEKIWPEARSGLGQPRQRRVKRSCLRGLFNPLSTFYYISDVSGGDRTPPRSPVTYMCLCAHMLHAAAEAGLGLWSGRQAGFRDRAVSRAVRDRGGAGAGAEIGRGGEGGWAGGGGCLNR